MLVADGSERFLEHLGRRQLLLPAGPSPELGERANGDVERSVAGEAEFLGGGQHAKQVVAELCGRRGRRGSAEEAELALGLKVGKAIIEGLNAGKAGGKTLLGGGLVRRI